LQYKIHWVLVYSKIILCQSGGGACTQEIEARESQLQIQPGLSNRIFSQKNKSNTTMRNKVCSHYPIPDFFALERNAWLGTGGSRL
jgi:hypothetical protein